MSARQIKLDAQATFRYPSDWDIAIEHSHISKAEWLRDAVREKLISENLISCNEPYFSHEMRSVSMNTLNTSHAQKNANVFKVLCRFLLKPQAQKKTDGNRSLVAHSSQG